MFPVQVWPFCTIIFRTEDDRATDPQMLFTDTTDRLCCIFGVGCVGGGGDDLNSMHYVLH